MQKEERILKTINRKDIDCLPSQITFSDRTRTESIAKFMGYGNTDEFEEYLQNHMKFSFAASDMPLFYRNDKKMMEKIEKMGFAKVDWEKGVVYDQWGCGIDMDSDGVFCCYHPLQVGDKKQVQNFMPDDLKNDFLSNTDEKAIVKYQTPDPKQTGNFNFLENDIEESSGDYLLVPSGYCGIFERAHFLLGYEELMINIALKPNLIEGLLDKITDYKIEVAKTVIKAGFKVGHSSDDIATQYAPMFSKKTFKNILKPRIARLWEVYKNAGLPVMFHSCGNITELIPDLIEIGLDVLEPVQPVMDLEYLKKEYGKDIIFWGGIDTQKILPYGTPEEVKELARNTIRILGQNGGHIIAPAQEIMKDVPLDNVKALVETIISEREKAL